MSNILTFPAGGRPISNVCQLHNPSFGYSHCGSRRYQRSEQKNMHSLVFRSRKLILETDDATLLADVRFDLEKAERKLASLRAYLRSFTEQAQSKIQELTSVEAKLGAAVEAARASLSVEG